MTRSILENVFRMCKFPTNDDTGYYYIGCKLTHGIAVVMRGSVVFIGNVILKEQLICFLSDLFQRHQIQYSLSKKILSIVLLVVL